jgi:hypothetical protein
MKLFPNLQPRKKLISNQEPYDPNDRGSELGIKGTGGSAYYATNDERCHGHYTYVVLPSTNPFAHFKDHHGSAVEVWVSRTLHHDDLAVGMPVHYAGTLDFDQGTLMQWNNHSGHYQPDGVYMDQAPRQFNTSLFVVVYRDNKYFFTIAPLKNDGDPRWEWKEGKLTPYNPDRQAI